jgi:hypothetical protein
LPADEAGHPQGWAPQHQLGRHEQERRSQHRRQAGWQRQHVGRGEQEHQGAEGPVSERVQHIAEADRRGGTAREITEDLGKSSSGFSVRVGGEDGRQGTRRVGHGPVCVSCDIWGRGGALSNTSAAARARLVRHGPLSPHAYLPPRPGSGAAGRCLARP